MIISKTVLVTINPSNIYHFESKNYYIPKQKDIYNKIVVKRGTQIEVQVSDLSEGSHNKVLCKCDNCEKESWVIFNNLDNKNKYICHKCSHNTPAYLLHNSERQKGKRTGKENPSWNPNLTDEDRKRNHSISGIKQWKYEVLQKDNYMCQCCGSHNHLEAHHIDCFGKFKNQRINVDNGITLCFNCHRAKNRKSIHTIYGKFTTRQNLETFLTFPTL